MIVEALLGIELPVLETKRTWSPEGSRPIARRSSAQWALPVMRQRGRFELRLGNGCWSKSIAAARAGARSRASLRSHQTPERVSRREPDVLVPLLARVGSPLVLRDLVRPLDPEVPAPGRTVAGVDQREAHVGSSRRRSSNWWSLGIRSSRASDLVLGALDATGFSGGSLVTREARPDTRLTPSALKASSISSSASLRSPSSTSGNPSGPNSVGSRGNQT